MTSETPRPDRCGARVTDKVGLEVHDDELDRSFTTDDRLETIDVSDGAESVSVDAEFREVMDYLRSGYNVTHVNLSPSEGSDRSSGDRIRIEDDDPYVTNHGSVLEGYCERYSMDNGRCYVHGGDGSGPPEGNQNAMTHGLTADRSNYYRNLDDEQKAVVQKKADSWIENAPFDRDNMAKASEVMRIAIDEHRLWHAHEYFDENGMLVDKVIDVDDDGNPIEVEDENPANRAYDRLDRTNMKKLKELGCLDDPESQKAEATESLAEKFSEIDDT